MRTDRLKKLRQAKGISQIEMAEALGFGSKEIWRYENGDSTPSIDKVAEIAQFLNVSIDYLTGLSDTPSMHESDLSDNERKIILALRHGDLREVMRVIASGE